MALSDAVRFGHAAAVLGSVATGVLHHTHRPVLVVREPETGDGIESP